MASSIQKNSKAEGDWNSKMPSGGGSMDVIGGFFQSNFSRVMGTED